MTLPCRTGTTALSTALCMLLLIAASSPALEQRNEITYRRGPYNLAFFYRHNDSYRYSSAFHYYHGKQHDVLQLTPLDQHQTVDLWFDGDIVAYTITKKARVEPTMMLYGPYVGMMAWTLYRAIDWTHMHHEQTYDILSSRRVDWGDKGKVTEKAVWYYLKLNSVARSCAPLDITMRRAGTMMKPYFTYYRNYYPRSNNFAYIAHWWHPVIYEAMMYAEETRLTQQQVIDSTNKTMLDKVFLNRPLRMLLSREAMPRYSRLSPESANIFDNLHMLHGIAYDILAYEGWTEEEKRAELYRVIEAMSYQEGDEKLARKFEVPYPGMDPRVYYQWMRTVEGDMTRIMVEMLQEMLPVMMPDGISEEKRAQVTEQLLKKLTPDFQQGEYRGSLADALKEIVPDMQLMPASENPGETPNMMIEAMLKGYEAKYGGMADVEEYRVQ